MPTRCLSRTLIATLLVLPQVIACASDSEARAVVIPRGMQAEEPAPVVTAVDPAPERIPGQRDPFVSPFDEGALTPAAAGSNPLTQQELDAFRLVGVVVGTATPMALFEDPQGRGYRARIGDLMGKRGGQVSSIAPGRVVVSERLYDPILGAQLTERVFALVRPTL